MIRDGVLPARLFPEAGPQRSVWPPVTVFFLVATVAAGLFGAVQPVTGVPAEVIQLTQFGPAVAVAVVGLCWPVRTPMLLRGALRGPGGGRLRRWPLLAMAPLIILVAVGACGLLTGDVDFTAFGELSHPFALIVPAQFLGACAEEIGWRCLLQPLMRVRFGPVGASVVVGVLWGLWHVPVFGQGARYAGGFLVATVSISVVLGLALERVRSYRLPLAAGFHTLINLGMLLFLNEESGAVLPMALFGASSLIVALAWAGSGRFARP